MTGTDGPRSTKEFDHEETHYCNCFALVFRNSASVGKEPAEVRVHGGRSATAHLSKLRKTQARIQKDDPYWQPCDYFSNYGENSCGDSAFRQRASAR